MSDMLASYRDAFQKGFRIRAGLGAAQRNEFVQRFLRVYQSNRVNFVYFNLASRVAERSTNQRGEYKFRMYERVVSRQTYRDVMELYFHNILEYVISMEQLGRLDYIQLTIIDNLDNRGVSTPISEVRHLDLEKIITLLDSMMQSDKTFEVGNAIVTVKYIKNISGGGYFQTPTDINEFIKRKKAIVQVPVTDDNNCFFMCLVYANAETVAEQTRLRRAPKRWGTLAKEERKRNDIETGRLITLADIRIIEKSSMFSIYVLDAHSLTYLYKSRMNREKKLVCLFVGGLFPVEGHFHYINPKMMGSLFSKRSYCWECLKALRDITSHPCMKRCLACSKSNCIGVDLAPELVTVSCKKCNRMFYDAQCFANHESYCKNRIMCGTCKEIYSAATTHHKCYEYVCRNCKQDCDRRELHECFIQPTNGSSKLCRIRYFDYECYMSEDGIHKVYGIAMADEESELVKWFDSTSEFRRFFLSDINKKVQTIYVSHNGSRYDMHFIKKNLLEEGVAVKTKDIVNGHTIVCMMLPRYNVKFIDSVKFIPLALRQFPKTFGFDDVEKGYFPYTFFSDKTLTYKGPMPGVEHFGFGNMKGKENEQALKWYDEHKEDIIDIAEMCKEYCIDDVKVLKKGCTIFRDLFLDVSEGKVDPFTKTTIAGVCLEIYRSMHLKKDTIGIIRNEYDLHFKGDMWVKSLEAAGTQFIEKGFTEEGVNIAGRDYQDQYYIYMECLDSGCRKCFNAFTKHPYNLQLMYQLQHDLWEKVKRLEMKGKKVIIKRECESKIKDTSKMTIKVSGGRTEMIYPYLKPDCKVKYYDVTSLYPYVLSGKRVDGTPLKFPIGHPKCIRTFSVPYEDEVKKYFGFVNCEIEPPNDLFFPVLGSMCNGKFMFDLKKKEGTWTTPEIEMAIQKGYRITKLNLIVHFEETSEHLFASYIFTFFKLKIIATGWRKFGIHDPNQRAWFLNEVKRRYGIDITMNDMKEEHNAGLYYISKLCLNSLWGKFGQRENFKECKDLFEHARLLDMLKDDTTEVHDVFFHNMKAQTVTYKRRRGFSGQSWSTNMAIACFTTSYARLELYRIINQLGSRVLYMDTDSVVFKDTGEHDIVTGLFLGELTNELDEDEWITEWVSTGPKAYAYTTNKGKCVSKVKGLSLSHEASKIINMESMKLAVFQNKEFRIKPLQFNIHPDHTIKTRKWDGDEGKSFRFTDAKRRKVCISTDEIMTFPFV